jgi:hypothetical protein
MRPGARARRALPSTWLPEVDGRELLTGAWPNAALRLLQRVNLLRYRRALSIAS